MLTQNSLLFCTRTTEYLPKKKKKDQNINLKKANEENYTQGQC